MYHKWKSYDVWFLRYNAWQTEFFVILDCFLPFYPPKQPKKLKFSKNENAPGDVIILHKCTKNHDHMLYCSLDMAHNECNCYFSFWAIFCFHPPNSPKYQNFKKNEKTTWSHHLTYVYQKLQSDDVWFLKYGPQQTDWQTDWQMDWQTEKVTCRGGCPTQIFLTKRVLNVACIHISPFLPALVSISFHSFVLQLRIN